MQRQFLFLVLLHPVIEQIGSFKAFSAKNKKQSTHVFPASMLSATTHS